MTPPLALPDDRSQERLSDAVYKAVIKAIVSGQLAPGTIISEVRLAKELKVSRTPVHDALRQLAKDGLIEQRANHRAAVARFSREDVRDIFDMRILLESEAARRAASNIDRATIQELRTAAAKLAESRSDPDWLTRWADFDAEFHARVAQSSGSPRLHQEVVRYRLLHYGLNISTANVKALQSALDEHGRILDALERRDPDEAAHAMASHIREWQAYFVNHFPI